MATGIPAAGFVDRDGLKAWLDSLPEADHELFSRIIAHRAAMRVLPFAARAFSTRLADWDAPFVLTQAVFRTNLTSRVAIKYQTRAFSNAAVSAAHAAYSAANAASAASDAAAPAADAASAAGDALAVEADAASASAASASADAAAIWETVSADAQALIGAAALLDTPLWPGGAPGWWREEWAGMQHYLGSLPDRVGGGPGSGQWQVWLDLYGARAEGQSSWDLPEAVAERLEMRITLGDGRGDFWERKPEVINAEISGWVDAARAAQRHARS